MSNDLATEPMSERDIGFYNSGVLAVLNEARQLGETIHAAADDMAHYSASQILSTFAHEAGNLLIGSVDSASVLGGIEEYEACRELENNSEKEKVR